MKQEGIQVKAVKDCQRIKPDWRSSSESISLNILRFFSFIYDPFQVNFKWFLMAVLCSRQRVRLQT